MPLNPAAKAINLTVSLMNLGLSRAASCPHFLWPTHVEKMQSSQFATSCSALQTSHPYFIALGIFVPEAFPFFQISHQTTHRHPPFTLPLAKLPPFFQICHQTNHRHPLFTLPLAQGILLPRRSTLPGPKSSRTTNSTSTGSIWITKSPSGKGPLYEYHMLL